MRFRGVEMLVMAVILAPVDRTAKPVAVESIQATNLLAEVTYNVYFLD